MAQQTQSLEQMIRELPPELEDEVKGFIAKLLARRSQRGRKLRQDWGGGLEDLRDQYTSLELQKKSLEWRNHD